MIERNYGDQDRATEGFAGIDRMNAQAKAERESRMPVPQWYADYIQRVLSDPNADPAQLGREAAMHPEFKAMVGGAQPQGSQIPRPQDSLSQVGPGSGPGYPALYAPGGVNPAHGPQSGLPAMSGPGAGSPMSQPGTGYGAPPPANPWQGAPQMQPRMTFGHPAAAAAIAPSQPQPQYIQSLGQLGQPTQGAPQVSPAQAGASGSGPAQPRAPRDFGPPIFRGGDTLSRRDAAMIAPQLPTAIAAQGRRESTQATGDNKVQLQQMKNQLGLAVAEMKRSGQTDEQIVKMLLGTAKEEGTQQRFVEHEKGLTKRAEIGADAATGSAAIRSKAGEDPDEKRLRNLETRISALKLQTSWETQPDLQEMVAEFETEADAAAQRLGKPRQRAGQKPQPKPGSGPGPAKAPDKAAPAGGKPGKIHVKLPNGSTGWVPEAGFDPKTMKKI